MESWDARPSSSCAQTDEGRAINLGVAHARSGERLRARAEAERALEINPDSARARALLEAVKQP